MAKFSDPNYQILKEYFDVLVAERDGNQKSYLLGPCHTIVSNGGFASILYEKNAERGFVGHNFKIKEIDGNRFKMTYEGLESTFSIASSAFGIGNEMYFRKDSFFHYWLARQEQDDIYHNYINQNKTFIYFGKIWPVASETNTYSIEFQGMKDFTLKGLPQHQQTVNIEEWLKVYWDQVHHEIYNMTKTFWSLSDAREIDIRWLAYIAGEYGVEISEDILNELPLREWVENLPSFLKRIGTYNALYIIWKVFLSNTKNNLNVYERWGEWCTQNLTGVIDEFEDHHILEFYGTQPSGGSGEYYYSRYNPVNYPIHASEAPTGSCGTYKWNVGYENENYVLFDYSTLYGVVSGLNEKEFTVTSYDPTVTTLQSMFLSAASPTYVGDFIHSIGIKMNSSITQPSNVVFWALSNEISQISDHSGDYISLSYEISGGQRYFKFVERKSGVNSSISTSGSYLADFPYYLIIDRTGTSLRARIYNRDRKWDEDIVETMILSLSSSDSYSNIYVLNGRRITGHNPWSGNIYKLNIDNIDYVQTIAASGAKVITPHYKVQIDLSTEPLGDIFNDDTIISESIIDELIRNFEFARPVSRYSHYEELISPIANMDRTGELINLYPLTSNGHMNTYFTGSQFISAGGEGLGVDSTYSHYQQFPSDVWTITHNLNSPYVLVQPWIFSGSIATGAQIEYPEIIEIIDNNTLQLTFNDTVRGVAAIAASGSFGVTFIEEDYISSPAITWNIDHNLNTNTPSAGYTNPPGPVIFNWNNNGFIIIPDVNDLASDDLMTSTWSVSSTSGSAIVRRSDYLHTQNTPSSTWSVNHGLNSWVIVQCYDLITGEQIIPNEVTFVDVDNIEIEWAENTRGYAHIIQIIRDNIVYSPYSCDSLGIGMCQNTLGYWKIGTGTSTSWNPFTQNDLETPVTSGSYQAIEQDVNNIYIDFIVPSNYEDVAITEIGLFNYLDQLILYSKCSDLFKPENVQCFFHYRIGKLSSSSSSSSSSSISSSSSSESSI